MDGNAKGGGTGSSSQIYHFISNYIKYKTLHQIFVIFRWWSGGVGRGAEQWEGDVRFLPSSRPQLWPSQIRPHQLGEFRSFCNSSHWFGFLAVYNHRDALEIS